MLENDDPVVVPLEPTDQTLVFNWDISTLFGWGVFGLNLLRHWRAVSGRPVFCSGRTDLPSLASLDPLSRRAIEPALHENGLLREYWDELLAASDGCFPGIILHFLGNGLRAERLPRDGGLQGRVTAAFTFFEDTTMPDAGAIATDFAVIVAGSTWCASVMRDRGLGNVATVFQGIDPAIFHAGPGSGALEGRFAVFSGGKLEFRKGQDLVLLAFRSFAGRHPDAVLVTAWHSPWPGLAISVNRNPAIVAVGTGADGKIDTAGWARDNGLRTDQFIDVGQMPNHQMASVLREMDVAVFANRCEGGTNLVAMECLACGIPTIVSDNTGHQDLIATGAPYALKRQRAIDAAGTDGWGESDVEEIVEALEHVWRHRDSAAHRGAFGAATMRDWSWRHQIAELHATLAPFCS